MTPRPSDAAIEAAGRHLAAAYADLDAMTPEEAAAAAYVPGGPSIEELVDRIRAMRETPGRRTA